MNRSNCPSCSEPTLDLMFRVRALRNGDIRCSVCNAPLFFSWIADLREDPEPGINAAMRTHVANIGILCFLFAQGYAKAVPVALIAMVAAEVFVYANRHLLVKER